MNCLYEEGKKVDTSKSNKEMANPPWGRWEVLLDEPTYKVKRITVLPGKRNSFKLTVLAFQKVIGTSEYPTSITVGLI